MYLPARQWWGHVLMNWSGHVRRFGDILAFAQPELWFLCVDADTKGCGFCTFSRSLGPVPIPKRRTPMFGKTIVRGSLAVAWVAATAFARTAVADAILPTGLAPGSQYQLAFVTADVTSGTSGSESYYNDFVRTQAAPLAAVLPGGTTWSAITSTFDGTNHTDASQNAPTYSGIPIYNSAGELVAASGDQLLTTSLVHPICFDQYGNYDPATPWTGYYFYCYRFAQYVIILLFSLKDQWRDTDVTFGAQGSEGVVGRCRSQC